MKTKRDGLMAPDFIRHIRFLKLVCRTAMISKYEDKKGGGSIAPDFVRHLFHF